MNAVALPLPMRAIRGGATQGCEADIQQRDDREHDHLDRQLHGSVEDAAAPAPMARRRTKTSPANPGSTIAGATPARRQRSRDEPEADDRSTTIADQISTSATAAPVVTPTGTVPRSGSGPR